MKLHIVREQSKEEGKGQESTQSSTTHYGMVWEGDKTHKNITYKGAKNSEIDMSGKTH